MMMCRSAGTRIAGVVVLASASLGLSACGGGSSSSSSSSSSSDAVATALMDPGIRTVQIPKQKAPLTIAVPPVLRRRWRSPVRLPCPPAPIRSSSHPIR